MNNGSEPLSLSVVVAIVSDTTDSRSDTTHLIRCLEALTEQVAPPPMEIIVPYHPRVDGIEEVKRRFPDIKLLLVDDLKTFTGQGGSREHHDELRARGMAAARGEIIALLEDVARPDPHWCARVVEAHRASYAGIGGAIENGIDHPLNWAVYFCDFGKYQNPVPAGESPFVSDANVSYKSSALASVQSVWRESFREPEVNWALASRGEKLALSPDVIVYQHRARLKLGSAVKERFIWGRSYAAGRSKLTGGKRLAYVALSPVLPGILLLRMARDVMAKRRFVGAFVKALPLTALLTTSWSWGELIGYLTGRTNS